jgi:drug/metabolite transporter (DMT)-like permease
MSATYVTALTGGKSANAVLLQYTAPLWLFLVGVLFLGEKADHRGVVSLAAGVAGIAVILVGGWTSGQSPFILLLGLASGVTFAGIVLGLRLQRDASPAFLTAANHLGSAVVLLPFALPWVRPDLAWPTLPQVGWLALFGVVQLGVPYALVARGLKSVSPEEAGTLTLLEPLMMPVWAYLVAPEKDQLTSYIFLGGALILLGLAYRYWPSGRTTPPPPIDPPAVSKGTQT